MTSVIDVLQAVQDRVRPVLPSWNTFWDEPSPIPFDAFGLRPDPGKFADYQQANSPHARWHLWMGLYVKAGDLPSARMKMGELTDPKGPLISRLLDRDEELEDRLWHITRGNVDVTTGRAWATRVQRQRFTDVRYVYCEIGLVCGSN